MYSRSRGKPPRDVPIPDDRIDERTPPIDLGNLGTAIKVVARDVRRALTLITFGICLIAGAIFLAAVVVWAIDTGYAQEHFWSAIAGVALALILELSLGWTGVGIILKGRRFLQRDALTVLREDSRRPVLFLRSFADEAASGFANTYERVFGDAVSHVGPFVAVGDPDEKLQSFGAARFYIDNTWRTAVLRLIRRSEIVIVWAAPTEGVLWELEQVVKQLDPQQVFLFFHLGGRSRRGCARYESFRLRAGNVLPHALPSRLRPCGPSLIGFDAGWKSRVLAPPPWGCWHLFVDRLLSLWLPVGANIFQSADVVLALRSVTKQYGRMDFNARALVFVRRMFNLIVVIVPLAIIWALL